MRKLVFDAWYFLSIRKRVEERQKEARITHIPCKCMFIIILCGTKTQRTETLKKCLGIINDREWEWVNESKWEWKSGRQSESEWNETQTFYKHVDDWRCQPHTICAFRSFFLSLLCMPWTWTKFHLLYPAHDKKKVWQNEQTHTLTLSLSLFRSKCPEKCHKFFSSVCVCWTLFVHTMNLF